MILPTLVTVNFTWIVSPELYATLSKLTDTDTSGSSLVSRGFGAGASLLAVAGAGSVEVGGTTGACDAGAGAVESLLAAAEVGASDVGAVDGGVVVTGLAEVDFGADVDVADAGADGVVVMVAADSSAKAGLADKPPPTMSASAAADAPNLAAIRPTVDCDKCFPLNERAVIAPLLAPRFTAPRGLD
ncbi:hypothetical protein [Solihabitans fulvus]|uniref:hypothetical protein n=1 Tax=Solihabitans fulvus TaxID=1892852 RepID=UPI0016619F08|nr:hypothetical protein [Solihabitans fulvus]